jgi:hypothetical protein
VSVRQTRKPVPPRVVPGARSGDAGATGDDAIEDPRPPTTAAAASATAPATARTPRRKRRPRFVF